MIPPTSHQSSTTCSKIPLGLAHWLKSGCGDLTENVDELVADVVAVVVVVRVTSLPIDRETLPLAVANQQNIPSHENDENGKRASRVIVRTNFVKQLLSSGLIFKLAR